MKVKKILVLACLSSAILGAGPLPAWAGDFKVRLKGDAVVQVISSPEKRDSNTTFLRNRFRVVINPEATGLDGALTYGAFTRFLSMKGKEKYDRSYIYFRGNFGTIRFGELDSFNNSFPLSAPVDWRPSGNAMLAAFDYMQTSSDQYGLGIGKLSAWRWGNLVATGNNAKIRYESPVMKGFQVGVAYTPRSPGIAKSYSDGWNFDRSKGGLTDAYEVALRFDSRNKSVANLFGKYILKAGIDYQGGAVTGKTTSLNDLSSFQAGLRVGYDKFTVGAGYLTYGTSGLRHDDANQVNGNTWRVGAQYDFGALVVGAEYNWSQKDVDFDAGTRHANDRGEKKLSNQFSIGGMYNLGKGVQIGGEYSYVKTENTYSHLEDSASVFVISSVIKF